MRPRGIARRCGWSISVLVAAVLVLASGSALAAPRLAGGSLAPHAAAQPPDTVITGGPANPTNATTASFALSSPDTDVTFQCSLDSAAFTDCGATVSLSGIGEGAHTFQARATTPSGLSDPSPASYSWTVDLTPPTSTLINTPAALSDDTTSTFTFTSPDATATFRCSLNGAAFAPCTSPTSYTGLGSGTRSFTEEAVDPAGNVQLSPNTDTWTVDVTPPDTTITEGPGVVATDSSALFQMSSPDPTVTSYECSLDGAPATSCSLEMEYDTILEGTHTFSVAAVDPSGNVDPTPAIYTWTYDGPDTRILSGPRKTLSNNPDPVFALDTDADSRTFDCKLDGHVVSNCCPPTDATVAAGFPCVFRHVGSGTHTVAFRTVDSAGEEARTAVSYTWTVDVTPPEKPSLHIGPGGGASPTATDASTYPVSWKAVGSGTAKIDIYDAAFDAAGDILTPGYSSVNGDPYAVLGTGLDKSVTVKSSPGLTICFVAVALDAAGNSADRGGCITRVTGIRNFLYGLDLSKAQQLAAADGVEQTLRDDLPSYDRSLDGDPYFDYSHGQPQTPHLSGFSFSAKSYSGRFWDASGHQPILFAPMAVGHVLIDATTCPTCGSVAVTLGEADWGAGIELNTYSNGQETQPVYFPPDFSPPDQHRRQLLSLTSSQVDRHRLLTVPDLSEGAPDGTPACHECESAGLEAMGTIANEYLEIRDAGAGTPKIEGAAFEPPLAATLDTFKRSLHVPAVSK